MGGRSPGGGAGVVTRRLLLTLAAVAVTGGAVAAALVVGTGSDGGSRARAIEPPADLVSVTPSITPSSALFGDRIVARVVVAVDSRVVDPLTVLVGPRFAPFDRIGTARVATTEAGATTVLDFRFDLQCVSRPCAPSGQSTTIELPAVEIEWALRDGADQGRSTFRWPAVTVTSRVAPEALSDGLPALASLEAPPVSYGTSPTLLRWLFLGGAAALVVAVGASAVVVLARRRSEAPTSVPGPLELTLVDAVELVERAVASPVAQRRTALDLLAELAEQTAPDSVAPRARRLAWGRDEPDRESMRELAALARALAGPVEDG